MSFQTQFSDSFGEYPGGLLDVVSPGNWAALNGDTATYGAIISNERCITNGVGFASAFEQLIGYTPGADQWASVQIGALPSDTDAVSIYLRSSDTTSDGYSCSVQLMSGSTTTVVVGIQDLANSSLTLLDLQNVPYAPGDTFLFGVQGSTVQIYRNGELLGLATSSRGTSAANSIWFGLGGAAAIYDFKAGNFSSSDLPFPSFNLTPLASDNFQRADEEPLDPANWTVDSAVSAYDLAVVGDQCVAGTQAPFGNPRGAEFYTGTVLPDDQYASLTVGVAIAISALTLRVRHTLGDVNRYYQMSQNGANVTLSSGDGSSTAEARLVTSMATGDVFTLVTVADNVTLLRNGNPFLFFKDSSETSGVSGLAIAAGDGTQTDLGVSLFTAGSALIVANVSGSFQFANTARVANGSVSFTLREYHATGGAQLLAAGTPIVAQLDANGAFTVALPTYDSLVLQTPYHMIVYDAQGNFLMERNVEFSGSGSVTLSDVPVQNSGTDFPPQYSDAGYRLIQGGFGSSAANGTATFELYQQAVVFASGVELVPTPLTYQLDGSGNLPAGVYLYLSTALAPHTVYLVTVKDNNRNEISKAMYSLSETAPAVTDLADLSASETVDTVGYSNIPGVFFVAVPWLKS